MGCSWAAASGVQRAGAYRVATRTACFRWFMHYIAKPRNQFSRNFLRHRIHYLLQLGDLEVDGSLLYNILFSTIWTCTQKVQPTSTNFPAMLPWPLTFWTQGHSHIRLSPDNRALLASIFNSYLSCRKTHIQTSYQIAPNSVPSLA